MRAGYSVKRIKDICDKGSSNVAQKDLEGHDGEYPIYGASGFIKNVDFFHQDREYVGIVKDGSGIGRVSFYPPKSSLIGTLQYIFPKAEYDIRYVGYCLQSLDLASYRQGAAIPHIYFRDYGEREVLVAENSEDQKRIVGILDQEIAKIDAIKANAEKSLQAAKDLFRKSMDILLSPQANWTETTLGEICSKVGSGATPSGGKRAYQKEGISLIRSLNVHNNEFRYEDLAHINAIQAASLNNVEIHSGDVLFNITGASVTRCCLVPDDVIPARVNQHVSILRLVPETLIPALLVFIMISPRQNELLMKTAENGATRQAITKRELEQWHIQYPVSTEEQQAIIAHLNDLDNKCKALQDNYQKTLSLCDDLKQSLLRKAFNGEL